MKAIIRRFREKDASIVSDIIRRNYLEVNIKDYSKDEMEYLAQIYNSEKVLELNDKAHLYVACTVDNVVGSGAIAPFQNKEDESILFAVFVLPEFQRQGIGKQIIKALENDEYSLRSKRIELWSSITACDFYIKLGYSYINGIKELNEEKTYRLEKLIIK